MTTKEAMKCPFEIGQTVRHKASGEFAVVVDIDYVCSKHTFEEHLKMNIAEKNDEDHGLGECVYDEFEGDLSVSLGFGSDDIEVGAHMIEAARILLKPREQ